MLRNSLILILICGSLSAHAAFDVTDNCLKAHQAIMRLQFEDARQLLDYEKSVHPKNQMPVLLDNYVAFLKAILSEDPKEIEEMEILGRKSIGIIEKSDKKDPFRRPALAQIHLLMAYLDSRSGNYLSPSLEIGRAYRLLNENSIQFPDFRAGDPQLGLMHILIGSIPAEYKWLPDIMQIEGSVKQGEAEIISSLENRTGDKILAMMATECMILLSMVAVQLTDNEATQMHVLQIFKGPRFTEEASQSPLLVFAKVMLLMKLGKNDDAISILTNRPHIFGQYTFAALDYYLGTAKLNRLDPDANKVLLGFTANFKGKNLIKSAYERLAWYYLLHGDKKNYTFYMERINTRGGKNTEGDKKADQDALNGTEPNVDLLSARLLFDGGYYQKSLEHLSCMNPFAAGISPHDRLEFYYRKARILHKMDRIDEALDYYIITIKQGSSSEYYFAANSALNAGDIYESRNQTEKAKSSYQKCLSLKYTEYKTGISMKARARLNILDKKKK
jgi:tetratricopeptide (TPR) repeat protein